MAPLVGGFMTAAVPLGAADRRDLRRTDHHRFGRRRVLMSAAALFTRVR